MRIEIVDEMVQFKCSNCGADNETRLAEKKNHRAHESGTNPMSITSCQKCGVSLKVVKMCGKIEVDTMPDNP